MPTISVTARYCHKMEKLSILSQIKESDDLLSLPQALVQILKQVDNPDFNADELARIILLDPPLTGRILKLANSSHYKRYSNISTVHQAVQVLGATTVKCLALSSSVFDPDKLQKEAGIDPKAYFANVLTVAAASEKLAEATGYKNTEEVFIAGLLHDIGTMFFVHHYPREYRKIVEGRVGGATSLMDAEQKLFGTTHTEVGFCLAQVWCLPDYICESIKEHHGTIPETPGPSPSGIVRLASLLVEDRTSGYVMDLEERLAAIHQAAEKLGLSKVQVDAVSASLLSSTISVAEYLGVDIGNIEEMLSRANKEIWRTYLMIENLFRERQEMNERLLQQERARGAYESKTIAMATLSHYLNNAAMAIYGRSQVLRMQMKKKTPAELLEKLPESLDIVDRSIRKMVAVLAEISEISPIDKVEFLNTSRAMNIDDRIEKRMATLEKDSGLLLPEDASVA